MADAAAAVVALYALGLFISEPENTIERRRATSIGSCEGYLLILRGCFSGYGERGDHEGWVGEGELDRAVKRDRAVALHLQ